MIACYSRTSIIRTSIIRTFRLSGLFLWSRFFHEYYEYEETCVPNSAFTASLSKDLALRDKEHSDAFSCILIGSVLFCCFVECHAIFISFVYRVVSLTFIFSIIRTLDYPDFLLRSRRVQIIEVRLYKPKRYFQGGPSSFKLSCTVKVVL